MRIAEVPKRLGIIGGGYIAVELAHVFSSFGCEVIMLVRKYASLQGGLSIRSDSINFS